VTYVYWNATSHCFSRLGSHSVDEILNERWLIPRNSSNQNIHEDHQFSLVETDLYISIGLDWDLAPLESTGKILIDSRCKCIFACYDLIPILFPEFSVEASLEQRFKHHLINIAQLTTSVFTISENTATDLHQFWNDADMLIPTPPTQKIELASLEQSDKLPHLSESDAVQIKHVLNGGNFVLYVSSIEARKNHRLLVNIWRELFSTRGNACPTLVFVGMPGWGTADLISQIRRSHAFAANKITVLTDTSDALLRYLYSYCLFSVFPSHYEGWGLAATEAMALGKVCVVANNSGLVEASQGLCPALHPLDYSGWKVEIEQLLDDELYRRELESNIRTNFRDRSWSQFSKDFCDKLVLEYSEPSFESDGSYNSGTLELEP
jgi:glycosyltransferase involved in cell wall biosynthesis